MKYLFLVLLIIMSDKSFSQQGTFVIATITKNGIVIGADSRGVVYESDDHSKLPLVFFDSMCKVFKIKQFGMAVVGASVIGNKSFKKVIEDFNAEFKTDSSLLNTLNGFIKHLDIKYPKDSFPERNSNQFVVGGYVNGTAQIIGIDSVHTVIEYTGTIMSDPAGFKYGKRQSSSDYDWIESIIEDYAIGENKTLSVGGPVSIILITPKNEIIWERNNFSDRKYQSTSEFYEAVKNDKIKMNYLVPDGKERLLKVLRH